MTKPTDIDNVPMSLFTMPRWAWGFLILGLIQPLLFLVTALGLFVPGHPTAYYSPVHWGVETNKFIRGVGK